MLLSSAGYREMEAATPQRLVDWDIRLGGMKYVENKSVDIHDYVCVAFFFTRGPSLVPSSHF
jgi:hypothetical protein